MHVTGGSGFLGGRVIPRLVSRGYEVSALARSDRAVDRVGQLGADPIRGDLDLPNEVERAFLSARAASLVNLASLGFGHTPTIVAAAEAAGLKRAIFISTTAIFTTLAARSKSIRIAAEDAVRASPLDWTILRPTMIYGRPGDRNMERLLKLLRRTTLVPLPGGGHRMQQPVHVDDLADAVVGAVERRQTFGQSYDLAGPEPITLRTVVEEAAATLGRHPRLLPLPLGPAIAAIRAYERLASRPRLKAEQLERLAEDKAFDISSARRDLDFDPRSFREGISEEAAQVR